MHSIMNKFAAIISFLLLLGTNMFSAPLVSVESDVYAVEIQSQSRPDADVAQSEPLPSAELEERQEESAILTPLSLFPSEDYTRYFFNHADKTLIGTPQDLVIPPNI